nr:DUF2484 family protein [Roseivivax sp. GX 12232]
MILVLCWALLANLLAMLPSRDNHWTRAYVLIALGIPLLGFVTYQNGPFVGLLAFAAGASMLRWPLRFLAAWLRRRLGRGV